VGRGRHSRAVNSRTLPRVKLIVVPRLGNERKGNLRRPPASLIQQWAFADPGTRAGIPAPRSMGRIAVPVAKGLAVEGLIVGRHDPSLLMVPWPCVSAGAEPVYRTPNASDWCSVPVPTRCCRATARLQAHQGAGPRSCAGGDLAVGQNTNLERVFDQFSPT